MKPFLSKRAAAVIFAASLVITLILTLVNDSPEPQRSVRAIPLLVGAFVLRYTIKDQKPERARGQRLRHWSAKKKVALWVAYGVFGVALFFWCAAALGFEAYLSFSFAALAFIAWGFGGRYLRG